MDWPIETATVSVMSSSVGDASIYTTATFGVMGGIGHQTVRDAAKRFVKLAGKHYDDPSLATDHGYPSVGRVRFYLICYDRLRMIEADEKALASGKDRCSDLCVEAHRVMTELRKVVEDADKKSKERK
jgi:hypothetical protein